VKRHEHLRRETDAAVSSWHVVESRLTSINLCGNGQSGHLPFKGFGLGCGSQPYHAGGQSLSWQKTGFVLITGKKGPIHLPQRLRVLNLTFGARYRRNQFLIAWRKVGLHVKSKNPL